MSTRQRGGSERGHLMYDIFCSQPRSRRPSFNRTRAIVSISGTISTMHSYVQSYRVEDRKVDDTSESNYIINGVKLQQHFLKKYL